MRTTRVLGIEINPVTFGQAVDVVRRWMWNTNEICRYVVTPNLHHARLYRRSVELRDAYDGANLIVPDGMPLIWAARAMGRDVPERVAGSDLATEILLRSTGRRFTYFLLGGAPGVAERARDNISRHNPNAICVGISAPEPGFEHDADVCNDIVESINKVKPDLLLLGLGAPKQESWIFRHKDRLRVGVALCVGATIDFLAGEVHRAPRWMQLCGLEWLHRILQDPKRLLNRYVWDAMAFPVLLVGDLLHRRRHEPDAEHND